MEVAPQPDPSLHHLMEEKERETSGGSHPWNLCDLWVGSVPVPSANRMMAAVTIPSTPRMSTTVHFWNATVWNTTNGRFGIEAPLQGLK